MQTISTKYLWATNSRPLRIKATHTAQNISLTIPYDHGLEVEENHCNAAYMLKLRLGWKNSMQGGRVKGGYVFTMHDDALKI